MTDVGDKEGERMNEPITKNFFAQIEGALKSDLPHAQQYDTWLEWAMDLNEWLESLPHRIETAWVVGRGDKEQFVKALRGEDD